MKAVIAYWSGTGNTENMANGILDGMRSVGVDAELFCVNDISLNNFDKYEIIVLGCPAMGNEVLEETEFQPFYEKIKPLLKNKQIALFGSYGWGEGEWMHNWEEDVKLSGAILYKEGLKINQNSDSSYDTSFVFGKSFGLFNV